MVKNPVCLPDSQTVITEQEYEDALFLTAVRDRLISLGINPKVVGLQGKV